MKNSPKKLIKLTRFTKKLFLCFSLNKTIYGASSSADGLDVKQINKKSFQINYVNFIKTFVIFWQWRINMDYRSLNGVFEFVEIIVSPPLSSVVRYIFTFFAWWQENRSIIHLVAKNITLASILNNTWRLPMLWTSL